MDGFASDPHPYDQNNNEDRGKTQTQVNVSYEKTFQVEAKKERMFNL